MPVVWACGECRGECSVSPCGECSVSPCGECSVSPCGVGLWCGPVVCAV